MAKTPMRCPFTERLCVDCEIYRGRHYYMCICKQYRGYIKPKKEIKIYDAPQIADWGRIRRNIEPWSGVHDRSGEKETDLKISLKVIDMESFEERYCNYLEAKTWQWEDTDIMRVTNGIQVTSWQMFYKMLQYYEQKGTKELVVYEAPRYILIGGG